MLSSKDDWNISRWFAPLLASAVGEVSACTLRVPIEVLKQRMQTLHPLYTLQPGFLASKPRASLFRGIEAILKENEGKGSWRGFYRGYRATLQREIPFSCLQFPLYEFLKYHWAIIKGVNELDSVRAATCGSIAGGVTGAITTPLDVLKTRTMLTCNRPTSMISTDLVAQSSYNPFIGIKELWMEGGFRKCFAGAIPRTLWISIGGFIFFGVYERVKELMCHG